MTEDPRSSNSPISSRVMWLIALILAIGALSLAVAALPGRARPLFLLPFAFGAAAAGVSIALASSLFVRRSMPVWLVTTALALGGYGQVIASTFQKFQSQARGSQMDDPKAALAIEMLKGTEHDALAQQMEKDLAARGNWDEFLAHRYAALGAFASRSSVLAIAIETLLVIAGVATGRRYLDANDATCQALGSVAREGTGSTSK